MTSQPLHPNGPLDFKGSQKQKQVGGAETEVGGGIKGGSKQGAGLKLVLYIHVIGVDVVPPLPFGVDLRREVHPGVVV